MPKDSTGSTEEKLAFEAWENQIEEAKRQSQARNKALGFEVNDVSDHFKDNKDLIVQELEKDRAKRPTTRSFLLCAGCEDEIEKDQFQRFTDEDGWSYTICKGCMLRMRAHSGVRPAKFIIR